MNFLPILLAVMTVFVGVMSINAGYLEREIPKAGRYASAQVSLYRSFALVVQQYVAANATYAGTITWAMLAVASTTPDSMKKIQMNSTWKAVADGAGNFVICAQLDEAAVGALGQMMPTSAAPVRTVIANQDYVWLGDPSLVASVTQCQ